MTALQNKRLPYCKTKKALPQKSLGMDVPAAVVLRRRQFNCRRNSGRKATFAVMPYFTPEELAFIIQWMDAGAPEN
jgi:hypothetical protein